MDNIQTEFDQAYWASQPPEVRAISGIADQDARTQRATELAIKGFTIDVPIMCWNWDPYLVMKLREDYGYAWVPSALQRAPSIAPGLSIPGQAPYDPDHPPAGSIHVSTNVADYPAWPAANPPVENADPVGPLSIGTLYFDNASHHVDGDIVDNARGKFQLHVTMTPFGAQRYWIKIG